MNKEQQMVIDFHANFGCPNHGYPTLPSATSALLRSSLIVEEASEFLAAARNMDMNGMVDALVDLLYVTYAAAVVLGVDLEPIFKEVHRANMTKTGDTDLGGKIQKGKDWTPPDIAGELKRQGWIS